MEEVKKKDKKSTDKIDKKKIDKKDISDKSKKKVIPINAPKQLVKFVNPVSKEKTQVFSKPKLLSLRDRALAAK